jgi:flagellar biosynthesis/type III secretory pathway chaperone
MSEDQHERQALLAEVADLMRALAEMAQRLGRPGSPSAEEVQALLARKEAALARLQILETHRQSKSHP